MRRLILAGAALAALCLPVRAQIYSFQNGNSVMTQIVNPRTGQTTWCHTHYFAPGVGRADCGQPYLGGANEPLEPHHRRADPAP